VGEGEDPYESELEKAMVLFFQASFSEPNSAATWRTLGRLAEIRALWTQDPYQRRILLEEAQTRFTRAALVDLEEALNLESPSPPETADAPFQTTDPFLASLAWSGRLRRGEVTLPELSERHGNNFLPPGYNPLFWEERFFLLQALGQEDRPQAIQAARDDFRAIWASMPIEAPWRGAQPKPGPPKVKKIEVLESWAGTLIALAGLERGAETAENLFDEALRAYALALELPLDEFEMGILLSKVSKAEPEARSREARQALWDLKDLLFQKFLALPGAPPEALADWGDDLLLRADRQSDARSFLHYLEEGLDKRAQYLEKAPDPARAYLSLGETLEWRMGTVSPFLLDLSPADRRERRLRVLTESLKAYEGASASAPDSLTALKAVYRVNLKLAALAPSFPEFTALFDKALSLSRLAASRDPDAAGSFFDFGRELLALESPPFPEAQERLAVEALTAFRQYLRSPNPAIANLATMADLVFGISRGAPSQKPPALSLLAEICRGLIAHKPQDPHYRFALGLALAASLGALPSFPANASFANSAEPKRLFWEALSSFGQGLELLSLSSPSSLASPWESEGAFNSSPLESFRANPESVAFLEPERFVLVSQPGATFSEGVAIALSLYLSRLFDFSPPETLPPWHKLQLASFLRRAAGSGYLPPEEEVGYARLAFRLLAAAARETESVAPNRDFLARVRAEEGLLLGEMGMILPDYRLYLRERALLNLNLADSLSPGAANYARALLAAWDRDESLLKSLLPHRAADEANWLWPPFAEALQEPGFRAFASASWFKSLWFGYRAD
jgi:hypothetical protein